MISSLKSRASPIESRPETDSGEINVGRQRRPTGPASRSSDSLDHQVRIEQIIASARVFLAVVSLAAIYVDPTAPSLFAPLAHALLGVYVAISVCIVVVVARVEPSTVPKLALPLHLADFGCASILSFLTEGPSSPFFAFFAFILLAAAYRWGLRAALVNGMASGLVLLIQVALVVNVPRFSTGPLEVNRVVVREAYLFLVAYLAGSLSEQSRRLRNDAAIVARLVLRISPEKGLRLSLQNVLAEICDAVRGRGIFCALEEVATARLFVLEIEKAETGPTGGNQSAVLRVHRLMPQKRREYLFDMPMEVDAFRIERGPHGGPLVATSPAGRVLPPPTPEPGNAVLARDWRALECVSFSVGDEWRARIFVVDPALEEPNRRLRFVEAAARQAAPVLFSLHLAQRLHRRAAESARAEVARELHDGVIQSLIGLEMKFVALHNHQSGSHTVRSDVLERAGKLLSQEVVNVRNAMNHLRPPRVEPTRLVAHIQEEVDNFRRQTGIRASFVSSVDEVRLPRTICRELALIVREALANVRKHSRARSVVLRLEPGRLLISDDGRGLGFPNPLHPGEVVTPNATPLLIRESVAAIGGALNFESQPGSGTRIEITFPQTLRWAGMIG